MAKRKLMELNLLDDFLISTMIIYPVIGEEFSREVLQIIFKRKFGKLSVTSQKVYPGSDTDKHGARLDVYLEEDIADIEILEDATIVDLEPNQTENTKDIEALPKRVRFYHAKIDTKALDSGEKYQSLKNVVVVMITSYDPFGYNLMKYTVKNGIRELPAVEYEDGAQTLFLYTKGGNCNVHEELKQLLHYMEHTTWENATTDALKRIHKMVEKVKMDEEVSLRYMKALERQEMWMEKGQQMERENTERERRRADLAESKVTSMSNELSEKQKELDYWKKLALGIT